MFSIDWFCGDGCSGPYFCHCGLFISCAAGSCTHAGFFLLTNSNSSKIPICESLLNGHEHNASHWLDVWIILRKGDPFFIVCPSHRTVLFSDHQNCRSQQFTITSLTIATLIVIILKNRDQMDDHLWLGQNVLIIDSGKITSQCDFVHQF